MRLLLDIGDQGTAAVFSPCRKYRYCLERRWKPGSNVLTFCMMNPSTADEEVNDPTINRCIGFAKLWNYDALKVVNLFAYRATDPKQLLKIDDPVGPENDAAILDAAISAHAFANAFVCAWGNNGTLGGRNEAVKKLLAGRELSALKISKDGHPAHPLYIPANQKLVAF